MNTITPDTSKSTRDHLLTIFAGIFAHPSTYADAAAFITDDIVGDDKVVKALWSYLQDNTDEPNLIAASVKLFESVPAETSVPGVLYNLQAEAIKLTPAKTVNTARALARVIVNTKRREHIKRALDSAGLGSMDIEAITEQAAEKFPHIGVVEVPSGNLDELFDEWEKDEKPDKIASGFAAFDALSGGLDIGITEIAGRSGDGKTAVLQAFALAQAFPNTTSFELRQHPHKRCEARRDDARPYVLFISAEMPRKAILSRFAGSLAVVDGVAIDRERVHAMSQSTVAWSHVREEIRAHGRLTLFDAEKLAAVTPEAVCATMHAWATNIRRNDPDATLVVCLDYLQFLDTDGTKERYEQLQQAMRQVLRVTNKHRLVTLVGLQCKDAEPGKYRPATRADIQASKAVINDGLSVYIVRRDPNDASRLGLHCDKARAGEKGWEAVFHFEGRYMALTEAEQQPEPSVPVNDSPLIDNNDNAFEI